MALPYGHLHLVFAEDTHRAFAAALAVIELPIGHRLLHAIYRIAIKETLNK
jgi:hypothetical protein